MKIVDNRKHSIEYEIYHLSGGDAFIYRGDVYIFVNRKNFAEPTRAMRVKDGQIHILPNNIVVTPIDAEFVIRD